MLEDVLQKLSDGHDIDLEEMSRTMGSIMDGKCSESEIAALLTQLHDKGESVTEVAGAATAMREHMTVIQSGRSGLLDTCGTGGDGAGTFNISTAAAIVTAAAGVPVAKHGNRGITSKSGSADVLQQLGVNIEAGVAQIEACLEQLGICFCFAPLMHASMKHVAPVRRQLGFPTIFNILGPLCNPARAPFQLVGVGRAELRPLLADALRLLGTRRAIVVHGEDGLDEVTLDGTTHVTEVRDDTLHDRTWTPADFGIPPSGKQTLLVDGPEQSAGMIRSILQGQTGPPRDIVVVNAAAALWTAGRVDSLEQAAQLAAAAIDDGRADDLLARLAELSHQ